MYFKKVLMALILPALVKSNTSKIDMHHDIDSKLYYVDAEIGSQKQRLSLQFMGESNQVIVYTKECAPNCMKDALYDMSKSESLKQVDTQENGIDHHTSMYDPIGDKNTFIVSVEMNGKMFNDQFKLGSKKEPKDILAIDSSNHQLTSKMSGFVGVYSYPIVEFNYKRGVFKVSIGDKEESEEQGIQDVENPKVTWHVNPDIETDKITREIVVDPSLQYIYIPNNDFRRLTTQVERFGIKCSDNSVYCYTTRCFKDFNETLQLTIGEKNFNIKYSDLFMDASIIGQDVPKNDECPTEVLSIFRSVNGNQDTWYLGTDFMKHVKVVFQQDPKQHFAIFYKDEPDFTDQIIDNIIHHKETYGGGLALFIIISVFVCFCCCRKDKRTAVAMNKTVDIEPFTMDFDDIRPEDSAKQWVRKTKH